MMHCDRRHFVRAGTAAMAAVMLPGCASLVARRVPLVDGLVRLSIRQHPELAEPGGSLRLLPDGWTEPLYVVVLDDGAFAAVGSTCTHRGCTVEPEGPGFTCPCHGSEYDRRGRVLKGPAARNLQPFPATVQGGELVIDVRSA
jgi:nitrite reductase/ring-hydroxylating ferredoxin subunit